MEGAIRRFPVSSGKCAALARVVVTVGRERDEKAGGRQVRPRTLSAARYVVPKLSSPPLWGSHTFGVAHEHAVDALTGADGCAVTEYLREHWEYWEHVEVHDVDVETVDPGIQDEQQP